MTTNCIELASDLSQRYRNTSPFDRSTDEQLPRYLSKHGLLLTMCWPWECALPLQATHISGSWINERIGPQVIFGPEIGLILDPLKVDITCIYPTDTASDGRDNAGCGPHELGPTNWVTRYLARKKVNAFKEMNFGTDTAWEDIACEYFFPSAEPSWLDPLLWDIGSDEEIIYQSNLSLARDIYGGIMGHPVCTCQDNEPQSVWPYFINLGPNGWDPLDWELVLEIQESFLYPSPQSPSAIYNWNEIIMSLPNFEFRDLIVSVFYLDSPEMEQQWRARALKHARGVSKMFGGKPVMRFQFDAHTKGDLLTCLDELKGNSLEESLPATGSPLRLSPSSRTIRDGDGGAVLGSEAIVKRREFLVKGPALFF